ncbi:30S ribosomal protein S30 [Sphingomonas sp. Leaf24]|uniref:ribosome hibernation-promoting factor, HPF/YfiA family n=1 Tax=unclassified Sphingomonas TaxID=196159 RepID=UPI0006FE014E|nr:MULTISPECIES: ribosome-associated translation inhibitor RaiA [unclassified Sphingomonas]KQM22516.1 30S ribosomal protein S30 [Sphingomonas sp. Leaf5]KQM94212.1 30S ribosomal protein S30 [Sphingomonas sp. Leaf24]
MDIRVSGHQVDTGDALKEMVQERLQGIADKYFQRAISANATFSKGPHDNGFVCDIVCHVTQGLVLKGHNTGQEAQGAFVGAADKIEKQLRRYTRRLKDRNAAQVVAMNEAGGYDNGFDNAGYTVFGGEQEEEEVPDAPLIIAETRVDVPDASVSDAVMMLDLRNTNALLFKNSGTGSFNMVYRRHDGTIGWVEPNRAA